MAVGTQIQGQQVVGPHNKELEALWLAGVRAPDMESGPAQSVLVVVQALGLEEQRM